MAVLGRLLVSSAERLDLPDLLSVDSYSGGDWKYFVRSLVGDTEPYILKGFDVIDPQNAIGTQSCSIRVANSIVYYPGSNSGSFFHGLEEGNANALPLVPELRKNAVNYVYLTFSTFNTSIDTRAFWDPDKDGGVGGEFTQDVNTEAVLKVDVNVSTGSFPANTIPVAKITVGPVVITAIEDARDLMFRLGTGGINPDPFSRYNFRSLPSSPYKRTEPPTAMTSPSDPNPFQGADKNIQTLKEWMDVVMTKLAELGGSVFWYEDAATYNLVANFQDALATSFKSKGQWLHDSSTPGLVTWTEDIVIKTTQDTRDTYIRAGSKNLANEQVMYVPLVRQQSLNGSDQEVQFINGQNYLNTVGGSLGLFTNLRKGDWVKKITDQNHLYLQVQEFYDTINLGGSVTTAANARSVRLSGNYLGSTSVEKGRFDRGEYLASDVVVSDRNNVNLSTAGGNFHWMAVRSDTVENVSNVQSFTLSGTLSETDGQTAKVTVAAHGLVDGDLVAVSAPAAQAGTYSVEVEDVNTFYIKTTNMTTGAFTATYAIATTAARNNGYGFQLESANHGFETGETVIVAGTTNYNGAWVINKRDATNFQFAMNSAVATETTGTATLARVNVRAEQGIIKLVQGESANIGELETQNIKSFVGMQSIAETYPFYSIPGSYNALQGTQNYNSLASDNLTARASRLSAMMADKAQDKAIKALASDVRFVTNTTNGAAQEITFLPALSTLTFAQPGSPNGNAVVALPDTGPGISLGVNQVAYVLIDRNAATTPSILVSDLATAPIGENVFVVAMRLSGTDVYLWDGSSWKIGTNPTHEFRANQDLNMKLVAGGTWTLSLLNSLSWNASAYIQIPGVASNRNEIVAGNVTVNAGECVYVLVNRDNGVGASTITPVVTTITSVPNDVDAFIIATNDGSSVVVGDSMRLIGGESKQLYAGASDQTITFIGASDASDSAPNYTSNNFILDGDSLTTAIGKLDTIASSTQNDVTQDRNLKLIGGGNWAWNSGTNQLTFTADAYIQIPGLTNARNTIQFSTQSPITLSADGDAAYVNIVRTAGGATNLTVTVAQINAIVPSTTTVIIARRVGSDVIVGSHSFRLVNGESKELDAGLSIQNRALIGSGVTEATSLPTYSTRSGNAPQRTILDSQGALDAIASIDIELDKFFGQLLITTHESSAFKVRIRGADKSMLDSTTLSQELNEFFMSFTGAVINFSTGAILKDDDLTALGVNFTPFSVPVGQYFWYGVAGIPAAVTADNRQEIQIQVTPAASANAVQANAPYPVIAGDKKLGAVQVYNNAGNIEVVAIRRLGTGSGSGTGTGDASATLETIKNRFLDSPFQLVTPNIARDNKATRLDPGTVATYSPASRTFEFASASALLSTQMLDANEFLNNTDALEEVELLAFWDLAAVDTAATYEVSRNGGNEYQAITMSRVGSTDLYRGTKTFTVESVNQVLSSYSTLVSTAALNATTQQLLSQSFTLANKSLIRNVTLELNKTGSPLGVLYVSIYSDSAGDPGSLLCESSAIQMSSISSGNSSLLVTLPATYVAAGTYHVVLRTDANYKSSFSAGVTQLAWRIDTAAGTPYLRTNNGTAWSAVTNAKGGYSLGGIVLDLRVRITSSAGSKKLVGYGILYDKLPGTMVAGLAKREVFNFKAVANNTSSFTLTRFVPDPDLLKCYYIQSGQVFKTPAFYVNGQQIVFPANSFNNGGIEADVTLVFDQSEGSSFDNSDLNALLLAANSLGSTDASIDRSVAGRGIFLRRPDGTLREIALDNSDNLVVYSV